jgi:hypothetical protein
MLPASGLSLSVREPTSEDELFVLETSLEPILAVLELGRRVARSADGSTLDWERLPATDLGAVALTIRRAWLGDALSTEGTCPAAACGEPIDVAFSVAAYLDHHRPRPARGALADGEPGWYVLRGTETRIRLPQVEDLLAVHANRERAGELTVRCVAPTELAAGHARRLDRALAALSPSLDDQIAGICPACSNPVQLRFEPCAFVLAELRQAFSGIYLETHLIAARYGWDEQAILGLPRRRRGHYARLAAEERAAPWERAAA